MGVWMDGWMSRWIGSESSADIKDDCAKDIYNNLAFVSLPRGDPGMWYKIPSLGFS